MGISVLEIFCISAEWTILPIIRGMGKELKTGTKYGILFQSRI